MNIKSFWNEKCKNGQFTLIKQVFLSFICGLMLSQNFDPVSGHKTAIRYIYHKFGNDSSLKMLLPLIVFTIVRGVSAYIKDHRINKLLAGVSVIFGILNTAGMQMYYTDHLPYAMEDWIFAVGYSASCGYVFYYVGLFLLSLFSKNITRTNISFETEKAKRVFLISFIIIFLGWLPWMIAFYPASADWDVYYPISMYLGFTERQQPWFYSMNVGFFYKMGFLYANINAGIYLYILIRAVLMSAIYARVVARLFEYGLRRFIVFGVGVYYAFVPVWGAYAKHAFKDTFAAAFFCYYITSLVDIIAYIEWGKKRRFMYGHYILASFFAMIYRNNFIVAIVPATVLLAVIFICKSKLCNDKLCIRVIPCLFIGILMLIVFDIYSYNVVKVYRIPKFEAMAVPLQQTARTVRDYGDKIDENDREALKAIFEYDRIAEAYDPLIADPIKHLVRNAGDKEIKAYENIWLRMMLKFPRSYIEAAISQGYGYYCFTPDQAEHAGNWNCGMTIFHWTKDERFNPEFTFEYIEQLGGQRDNLAVWAEIWHRLPVLGWTDVKAVYTWLIVLIGVYLVQNNRKIRLCPIFSSMCLLLTCCVSAVNDSFRYYAPIAAATPVILLLLSKKERKGEKV